MDKLVQKSIRLSSGLVEFVNSQPGNDFSKKLVGILTEYRDGELERRCRIQKYDEQIAERRKRLDELVQNVNKVTLISRRVDELVNYVGDTDVKVFK